MKHIVMFSGGVGSWMAAKRVAEKHGTDDLILLFADTKMEDEDLYRFLDEAAADAGGLLVKVAEGRDPWQVFFDEKYLGNTRWDPCSDILKRKFLRAYIDSNFDPKDTTIHLGIDWSEIHRIENAASHWVPWKVEAPMCEKPYLDKQQMFKELKKAGIELPRLYKMGFPHNNCGGFCVKAGQAHFRLLLKKMPERYAYHEKKEQEISEHIWKNKKKKKKGEVKRQYTILRDRTGGTTKPISLKEFRERIEKDGDGQCDMFDWGGCGCFSPNEYEQPRKD